MENKQKKTFLESEGSNWFLRNGEFLQKAEKIQNDSILRYLSNRSPLTENVLEIGCSNGWRLAQIKKKYPKVNCYGVEPGLSAITSGEKKFPEVTFSHSTADELKFENSFFNTVILGFCLYLCDPADLFKIAYEVDRVLKNNGTLIILDFTPPFPYKNNYEYSKNTFSFKMNYSKMFLWNPFYTEVYHEMYSHGENDSLNPDDRTAIIVLKKHIESAFPDNPF